MRQLQANTHTTELGLQLSQGIKFRVYVARDFWWFFTFSAWWGWFL